MIAATVTDTEMQNDFAKYLNIVMEGKEVIITKNGKEVGRFVPKETTISYLTDSLTGVLKGNYDLNQVREEGLKEKYEIID